METNTKANTSLHIPIKLKIRAKKQAAHEQKSLTTLIIEAINQYLKTSKP